MDEFKIRLGRRIREVREECEYTREKLSELTGIDDKYIYEIEHGRKNISAYKLSMLSNSLGVSMDFLAFGEHVEIKNNYRIILLLLDNLDKTDFKNVEEIIRNIITIKNNSTK